MAKIVNVSGQYVKFKKDGFVIGTQATDSSSEKSLGMRMTYQDWKEFGKWFAKNKKSLTKKPKAPKPFKLKTAKDIQLDGAKVEKGAVVASLDKPNMQ